SHCWSGNPCPLPPPSSPYPCSAAGQGYGEDGGGTCHGLPLHQCDVGDAKPLPRRHVDHTVVRPVALALHPQPVRAGRDREIDLWGVPDRPTVEVHAPPGDRIDGEEAGL